MSKPRTARIGVWNVQWATPRSKRAPHIQKILRDLEADVLVVTEGVEGILPEGGHVVTSGEDYGYPIKKGRRKVILWSRNPWTNVDAVGSDKIPTGRFVQARTSTPIGELHVMGVCIPWSAAHVSSGRKDRKNWQDHLSFLAGLEELKAETHERLIVAGDYNQRVPRDRQPKRAFEALERTFESLQIATQGEVPGSTGLLIDHVAHGEKLEASDVKAWPKKTADGVNLSDHDGVRLDILAK